MDVQMSGLVTPGKYCILAEEPHSVQLLKARYHTMDVVFYNQQ